MPATSTASRGSSASARNEVIDILKADHKRAKKAFRDFEKLDPTEDAEQCRAIVEQVCAELTLHARLEEECFYPAARGALEEPDLIDEAEVEHQSAKDLIGQLQGTGAGDDKYAAKFTVLGEYINHHVKEEEGEMFPQLSRTKLDWDALLQEMTDRRAELMQELMPEQAGEETDVPAVASPSTAKSRGGARAATSRRAAAKGEAARPHASGKIADDKE